MKILSVLGLALVAVFCVAAEPSWNPADAVKEAEQDIRSGHIKFYWAGSVGVGPVGVPMEVAKRYPRGRCRNWVRHERRTTSRTTGRICPPVQREDLRLHHTEALIRAALVR
jgi:hypothetical protein